MSGWNQPQSDTYGTLQAAQRESGNKRRRKDPCHPLPAVPTGIALNFDTVEKRRHDRIRLKVVWNEVTNDAEGDPVEIPIHGYVVNLQKSEDNSTWDTSPRRHYVKAHDADADTVAHCLFFHISKHFFYRARVRAVDDEGFRSDFSAYTVGGSPTDTTPPPTPTKVTIFDKAANRIVLDWDAANHTKDSELISEDIAYFQAQIATTASFSTPYKFDRYLHATKKAFKVADADEGLTFYGRVRSVDASGNKSAWINATKTGNSGVGVSPDGVKIGSARVVATFSVSGPIQVKHYGTLWTAHQDLTLKRVSVRFGRHDTTTHPDDGCPTGSAAIVQVIWSDNEETTTDKLFTLDNRLTVPTNKHRDTAWADDLKRTSILDGEHLSVKVTQVGSTSPGSDMVVEVVAT